MPVFVKNYHVRDNKFYTWVIIANPLDIYKLSAISEIQLLQSTFHKHKVQIQNKPNSRSFNFFFSSPSMCLYLLTEKTKI